MKNKFKICIIITTIIFMSVSNIILTDLIISNQNNNNNIVGIADNNFNRKVFAPFEEEAYEHEKYNNCEEMLGSNVVKLINLAYLALEIIAPILFIVLAMVDFTGAITAQDKEALKKAFQKSLKRLIPVVLIFLLPLLIKLIGWIANLDVSCIS